MRGGERRGSRNVRKKPIRVAVFGACRKAVEVERAHRVPLVVRGLRKRDDGERPRDGVDAVLRREAARRDVEAAGELRVPLEVEVPRPVGELHLAVHEQAQQRGERRRVEAVNAVEDGERAAAHGLHERRGRVRRSRRGGGAPLEELARRHVAVKEDGGGRAVSEERRERAHHVRLALAARADEEGGAAQVDGDEERGEQ